MKILILSHNPITTYNSMGRTFLGLFSEFKEEELCQIYVYPTIPDISKCKSYYRITDKNVLQSLFIFNRCGREILDKEIKTTNSLYEKKYDNLLYSNKEKNRELKLFLRNIAWNTGHWYTNDLNSWIERENPDIIFAAPGVSSFFYDVIGKVAKKFSLPIVLYVCDDFYFSSENKGNTILEKVYYKNLRKKIKNIIKKSASVISICNQMTELYSKTFDCKAYTIFSGSSFSIANGYSYRNGNIIRYFGNLQLGRMHSILEIGKAIEAINEKWNTDYVLEIYSMDVCSNEIKKVPCIRHMGFVPAEKLFCLMKEAILLLHIESFEKDNIERTKYSISTKIPDILSIGTCLFAYGPKEIASIQHLEENKCAFLAFDKATLTSSLETALFDENMRKKVTNQAIQVAKEFHLTSIQSEKLRDIMELSCNEVNSKMKK